MIWLIELTALSLSLSWFNELSMYTCTPTFSGDHTVIHHSYPQTAWCHRSGGVVLYHQPLFNKLLRKEKKWGWKGDVSKIHTSWSFSNLEIPNNTHPVCSAWTYTFRVYHTVAVAAALHSMCSLTCVVSQRLSLIFCCIHENIDSIAVI